MSTYSKIAFRVFACTKQIILRPSITVLYHHQHFSWRLSRILVNCCEEPGCLQTLKHKVQNRVAGVRFTPRSARTSRQRSREFWHRYCVGGPQAYTFTLVGVQTAKDLASSKTASRLY